MNDWLLVLPVTTLFTGESCITPLRQTDQAIQLEMGNLEPPRDMDLEVTHNQKKLYPLVN